MKRSRSFALLVPVLALALTPAEAPAGEPLDPLDDEAGAIPIGPSLPPSPAGLVSTERPQRLGAKILFVNFDGQDMNGCNNNNPVNNCSTIFNGVVLPYTGDAVKRASIIQVIRKRVADFGITVTDQRPASGDYDMEMVGNWQGANPGFAGVAPNIDCNDATGGETSFTLEASSSADGIAEIVLQELAHTWGLEHVDEQQDLLFPTTAGSNKTFHDECYKIVEDTALNPTNGWCNQVHTQFCSFGWQNSYRELLYLFGESVPDTIAPLVTIVSPADGATLEGGTFDLVLAFEDDQSPAVITTNIRLEGGPLSEPVEVGGAYAAPGELAFPIQDLPDGTYSVRVDAEDESDNPAQDEITFTVVGNPPAAGDDGADGSGSEGSGSEGGTGDGADGSGSADATGSDDAGLVDPQQPLENGGCDCRTDRPPSAPAALLLGLLLVRRRRRP
ncbi:MYXO-CTERM sorting domain-containing protein [Paraliomyxa miuraensis]|uniref:MYXO-CTERM sorting domain-containing protein n=1 Tax=Paraliomyxa miuraensis TaxID=376150 RepID=UPI0022584F0A|nr:Ig-like domain-containing protein [Paraliomyxa miuraensis]MCX4239988.1 Ig-like domain-containing protein [Paraliomyxa miuraensis]